MKYPFEFNELLLTNKLLDTLGFTEYWSGCGDFGDRRLQLVESVPGALYQIWVIDESEDPESGYSTSPQYNSQHFSTEDWGTIYFLHELYEDIKLKRTEEELTAFVTLIKKRGVNMGSYIESYLEYKDIMSKFATKEAKITKNSLKLTDFE